ncbi:MAG: hypothetical protein O7A03_08415 [Alphaproteobacteria bacterium]|nr:hypothetical protein [Alphaproteobacteria bacterium]
MSELTGKLLSIRAKSVYLVTGAVLFGIGVAVMTAPANASHLTQQVIAAPRAVVVHPAPHAFTHWTTGRHVYEHDADSNWYHTNVSADHRFLPSRFHGQRHYVSSGPYYNGPAVYNDPHNFSDDGFARSNSAAIAAPAVHRTEPHRETRRCNTINGGTLVGAALGGLIGSQIGSGGGQLAATGAGVFIGGAIGSRAACR